MYGYHIWRAWYNSSYTMMLKPIRALELHYPMIQFLIISSIFEQLSWEASIRQGVFIREGHLIKT